MNLIETITTLRNNFFYTLIRASGFYPRTRRTAKVPHWPINAPLRFARMQPSPLFLSLVTRPADWPCFERKELDQIRARQNALSLHLA